MPGAGKSTWGKKLAAALQYKFVDLDELIVQQEQQSIADIFEQKGETNFRDIEHQYLKTTFELDKVVISCGGGTPCFQDNMKFINENGISIFLNAKKGVLVDRILNAKKQRPLFLDLNKAEIEKKMEELLQLRNPFYEQAFCTFCIPQESIQTFVNKAVQLILQLNY
jgi:shikimate kinase